MKRKIKRISVLFVAFVLMALTVTLSVGAEDVESESEDTTFFGEVYTAFSDHSAEVFSALSLLGSCVLAFTYRNGLIPSLRQGVGGIGSAVSEIREQTETTKVAAEDLKGELNKRLGGIEQAMKDFEARLIAAAESEERLCALSSLMDEQVSLLYDIFMSSSIPEYKKEAVGRRVERMRTAIAEKSVAGDEKTNEC